MLQPAACMQGMSNAASAPVEALGAAVGVALVAVERAVAGVAAGACVLRCMLTATAGKQARGMPAEAWCRARQSSHH